MPEERSDSSAAGNTRVIVFPPVIPLTGFLLGVLLERIHPAASSIALPLTVVRVSGGALFGLGAAGFVWMVRTMKKSRTPIHNSETPTALVETGPFRWTRNPMYLFGSIAYAGLALLLVQPWSLALLPVVFATTHFGVVLREEALLERQFGEPYRQYKARVRRWL